jgi:hypothetical protein
MPTETTRPSLTTDLATRYATQQTGEAFNSKLAGTATAPLSIQAKLYDTNPSFIVNELQEISNFENVGDGGTYKEVSKYSSNINTTRYK